MEQWGRPASTRFENTDMQQTPSNLIDDLIGYFAETSQQSLTVQLELSVTGQLDADRLSVAISRAAAKHPLARARSTARTSSQGLRASTFAWDIADHIAEPPLSVVDAAGDADIAAIRERFYSSPINLDQAPPFAVLLVHDPAGDHLMVCLDHTVGDGQSIVRLTTSILRAYLDIDDPVPTFDPLSRRDTHALFGARSWTQRRHRAALLLDHLRASLRRPAPIASKTASPGPGYGFELIRLDCSTIAKTAASCDPPATINDVLIAALILTASRWNTRHQARRDKFGVMGMVNLRPQEWWREVIGNYFSFFTVSLPDPTGKNLSDTVAAINRQTRKMKTKSGSGQFVDLFHALGSLPTRFWRRSMDLTQPTGLIWGTAILSNLTKQNFPPDLGPRAGAIREVTFSPPAPTPVGLAIGAITVAEELTLTIRYTHDLFDAAAAAEFTALYRQILLGAEVCSPTSHESGLLS